MPAGAVPAPELELYRDHETVIQRDATRGKIRAI